MKLDSPSPIYICMPISLIWFNVGKRSYIVFAVHFATFTAKTLTSVMSDRFFIVIKLEDHRLFQSNPSTQATPDTPGYAAY